MIFFKTPKVQFVGVAGEGQLENCPIGPNTNRDSSQRKAS